MSMPAKVIPMPTRPESPPTESPPPVPVPAWVLQGLAARLDDLADLLEAMSVITGLNLSRRQDRR